MSKLKLYELYRPAFKASGLSRAEVARRAGLPLLRITALVNGYHALRDDELAAVDAVLGAHAPKREPAAAPGVPVPTREEIVI